MDAQTASPGAAQIAAGVKTRRELAPLLSIATWTLTLALALATCLEQWRLLAGLSTRYMNVDHALLWLAARDWAHLAVGEPTFYGQPYGVTFEAIPTALLHACGVPYNVALPTALTGMGVGAWWLLAWSAYRRGLIFAALLAMAAPLLLNLDHWVIVSVYGTGAGRLLAAVCAGMLIRGANTPREIALAVAVGGFAAAIDSASGFLVAPALLWAGLAWLPCPRKWSPVLLGLCAPLAWFTLNAWFTRVHPDHNIHAGWQFVPELQPLLDNLHSPERLFRAQSLELFRRGLSVPAALGLLLLVTVYVRAWREAAAVGCVLVLMTFVAALPKSLESTDHLWWTAARMTLTCPMGLWFVFSITLHAAAQRLRVRFDLYPYLGSIARLTTGLLVVASVSSAIVRNGGWERRIRRMQAAGLNADFMRVLTAQSVLSRCEDIARVTHDNRASIVAFPEDGTANYACAALYPELLTVHPLYERRFWVLEQLASQVSERVIIWGAQHELCTSRRAHKLLTRCEVASDGHAVLVGFKPNSPLDILNALGYKPRPFGSDCIPSQSDTCKMWAERFGR